MPPSWVLSRTALAAFDANSVTEAGQVPGAVLVRDTTQQGRGPELRLSPGAWERLISTIKR